MAEVSHVIRASPERIFAVLADGWSYSDWVVGTVHIRDVDDNWPAVGARLHHRAGPWPLSLQDASTVIAVEKDRQLTLRAGLWPLGEATVRIELEPLATQATRVVIAEDFYAGPLRWIHTKLNDLFLHKRNEESLRRLADIAVRADKREVISDDF